MSAWLCFCGETLPDDDELVRRHREHCDVFQQRPTLRTKRQADEWVAAECDRCLPAVIDLIMDSRVQQRLAALGVPHALHIHGSALAPFITLRFVCPIGTKRFTTDAAVNQVGDIDAVLTEAEEIVEVRKQHSALYGPRALETM